MICMPLPGARTGSKDSLMAKLVYGATLLVTLLVVMTLIRAHTLLGLALEVTVTFVVHLIAFATISVALDRSGDLQFKSEYEPLEKKYIKNHDAAAYRDGLLNMQNQPKTEEALNTWHMSLCEAFHALGDYDSAMDHLQQVTQNDKDMKRRVRNLRNQLLDQMPKEKAAFYKKQAVDAKKQSPAPAPVPAVQEAEDEPCSDPDDELANDPDFACIKSVPGDPALDSLEGADADDDDAIVRAAAARAKAAHDAGKDPDAQIESNVDDDPDFSCIK